MAERAIVGSPPSSLAASCTARPRMLGRRNIPAGPYKARSLSPKPAATNRLTCVRQCRAADATAANQTPTHVMPSRYAGSSLLSEQIRISTPDGEFGAYMARPGWQTAAATAAPMIPAPVIIVIQEILGVNAGMRQAADEFAEAGFIAICPDLFWRLEPGVELSDDIPADWEKGVALYQRFDLNAGVRDIAAAITAGRSVQGASGKVGVMGFCLGGLVTFLAAARTDMDAAVAYYGGNTDQHLEEAGAITCPLMMHLAGADEYISPAAQQAIKAALAGHPRVEIYDYPGRNHAFARNGGQHYDAADARRANGRTTTFFRTHLG